MAWRKLGEQIRALRDQKGLTREALAEKAQLSSVYLKKLEAGERLSPSLPALERIARALGATLHVELVARSPRRKGGRNGR
jgi:transcriptional regulator with XRE-family HTH domain